MMSRWTTFGRFALGALAAAALGGGLGCGDGAAGPTRPSTPAPPDYSGNWSGQTEGQDALSFSVSGGQVASLSLSYTTSYVVLIGRGTFSVVFCRINLRSAGPVALNGNRFDVPVQSTVGSTVVRGAFSSETMALGSVDAFNMTRGCGNDTIFLGAEDEGDSWQAQRQ